ncbi:hypothetical protein HYT45_02910 [Candidatus Uhrbacteria bacterium]|nr:hypothetical protein [Candidatus Uhrbacteria bacterium]
MEQPLDIRVFYDNEEIVPDRGNGVTAENLSAACIGNHLHRHVGKSFELAIVAPRSPDGAPVVFEQDGKKNIARRRDMAPENPLYALYGKSVYIFANESGELYTKFPQNVVRLLYWSKDGNWRIEEISIVCQKGSFYLVCNTRLYTGRACRAENGSVIEPVYFRWADLNAILNKVLAGAKLANSSEYVPDEEEQPDVWPEEGVVKYYNPSQHWGSVYVLQNGELTEARVHMSQIKRPNTAFAYLAAGERVKYTAISTALGQTMFKYELYGVTPVAGAAAVETYSGC